MIPMVRFLPAWLTLGLILGSLPASCRSDEPVPAIPAPLEPWRDWVLEGIPHRASPATFNDAQQRIAVWPRELRLEVEPQSATWELTVRAFDRGWLTLPGDDRIWPRDVLLNDQPVPVVARAGLPALRLTPGTHTVTGRFAWSRLPEQLAIPAAIGMVSLSVDGVPVLLPDRDTEGVLWLKRRQPAEPVENRVVLQVHRLLEDGVPAWLQTELELSVTGSSREEQLGGLLPEGWSLAQVSSAIPVLITADGRLKAQVRAGTWRIQIAAFRTVPDLRLAYSPAVTPAVPEEWIAFRAQPHLRQVEFTDLAPVEARGTSFPQAWLGLPVRRWKNTAPLVGVVQPAAEAAPNRLRLRGERRLWVADDGLRVTYHDSLEGDTPDVVRLNAALGHQLGTVRLQGERQLLTRDPESSAEGLEIRVGTPQLQAVGQTALTRNLSATGWQTDLESLRMLIQLPPGWRMLAVFGADRVEGDWLTAWTLLDLFVLLVFTMGVSRLRGWAAGGLACVALGLSYHEASSPRFTWSLFLIPTALLSVVRHRHAVACVRGLWLLALGLLLLILVPHVAGQIQMALYPQLEPVGRHYRPRSFSEVVAGPGFSQSLEGLSEEAQLPVAWPVTPGGRPRSLSPLPGPPVESRSETANMSLMAPPPTAFTQTGLARPTWTGNTVTCVWDGPVQSGETIRLLLLPAGWHRALALTRALLLVLLLGRLLKTPPLQPSAAPKATTPLVALGLGGLLALGLPSTAIAQNFPDPQLLDQLRERLLKPDEAFPLAAEIPRARLRITAERLQLEATLHAATGCAVPIPGQFPVWSPLQATLDGEPAVVCRRPDGHLWVWTPPGVHELSVTGHIPPQAEWVWTALLVPRHLEVEAPDWQVTGLKPDAPPDRNLFFSKPAASQGRLPAYDQPELSRLVQVDRVLELGPIWKVHTTVRRLSPPGAAVTLRIPPLPGERVVSETGDQTTDRGPQEITLAADAETVRWEGELPRQSQLTLTAPTGVAWVERWGVVASAAWQVRSQGLPALYDAGLPTVTPIWLPWPGQAVTLQIEPAEAVANAPLTLLAGQRTLELGARRRSATAEFLVESSVGGEFVVGIPAEALVHELRVDGRSIPVRREGEVVRVNLRPGEERVAVDWTADVPLGWQAGFDPLTLPVEANNLTSRLEVPESRWILWCWGPQRGPAVRFWSVLILAVLLAVALGRVPLSPLRTRDWLLLAVGLTQVPFPAGATVVAWLFCLAWRGRRDPRSLGWFSFDLLQLLLVGLTVASLAILVTVVSQGLLGRPEMFIAGNGSTATHLQWLDPHPGPTPQSPSVVSVSIWYYRLLMLLWGLWLANAVIRWLGDGWSRFTAGGAWRWWKPRTGRQPAATG